MRRSRFAWPSPLVVALASLAATGPLGCDSSNGAEDARAAVREADAAWSRTSEKRDFDAFLEFVSDSSSFYSETGRVHHGKTEVGAAWKPLFASEAPALTWEPLTARVARSGDLGYTEGRWKLVADGPDGHEEATGKYVTIWRKEADGKWRAVLDIGSTDKKPEAAAGAQSTPPSPPASADSSTASS